MFRRNTVDGILSSITKSLSKLATVAEQQRTIVDTKIAQMNELKVQARSAEAERERALRVHAKLSQLVS